MPRPVVVCVRSPLPPAAGNAACLGCRLLLDYQTAWLQHDLIEGLVPTTMLIPVGIAYTEASRVPVT